MTTRTKPYKTIANASIRVDLTEANLKMLKKYQGKLQEMRGHKASAGAIINECLYKYLLSEV
ncbi:hypothetical protein [Pseudoalteromonas sp. NZS11]|uniref:hypothetical protein n=1 Tax=Pseudoalteromonas sp. NZS11 TaxID=2792049 RepID=UPI0018CFD952|nr:hypothetical protein [Pseudoalteromonas sp. NZS11]MBH0080851.1 hypothetical protein [Pseudoalteromonas sp. NZS11]